MGEEPCVIRCIRYFLNNVDVMKKHDLEVGMQGKSVIVQVTNRSLPRCTRISLA